MRPDQLIRLREIEERLADMFIDEADPANWPEPDDEVGLGARRAVYAVKRSATETAALLARTQALMTAALPEPAGKGMDDEHLEQRLRAAERSAQEAVNRALQRAKHARARTG